MNIGIVTLPLIDNYGCILQNYALQQVLINMGHKPITFDIRGRRFYRRILSLSKQILTNPLNKKSYSFPDKLYNRSAEFNKFIENNINTTSPIFKYSSSLCKKYNLNAVIVGSDQVWRPEYSLFPNDMYLEFVPNDIIKLSYAASFGKDQITLPNRRIFKISSLLSRFAGVSVRELSGIEICKELFSTSAIQVIDPTLLIDMTVYKRFCRDIPIKKNTYIGAYILDSTRKKENLLKRLSDKLEIEPVTFNVSDYTSPKNWLAFFRDADFILTDSFHGMVFSIIFNKQFIVINNSERGSSRFNSLLSQLNIINNLINEDDFDVPIPSIDYIYVNNKIKILKKIAIEFLQKNLE